MDNLIQYGGGMIPDIQGLHYIIENNLPFKYTGDGSFWITINGKHYNPDFVCTKKNKTIIAAHGCYWHNCPICYDKINIKSNYKRDKNILESDWSVLEVWEHEIVDGSYKAKIDSFVRTYVLVT
jgi:G:T-mismatch repair DNA endonuclease (very short patch repair protein)